MSITSIAIQRAHVDIQMPETGELRSAKDVSARNAQELQMKVSVAVLKEVMAFEKQMAEAIVDMLV